MERLTKTFTSHGDWCPLPWAVFEVVPLYDDNGNVLAYCERTFKRTRPGIPTELFNHAMKEVDPSNPEALAAFMSEYGLLGIKPRGLNTVAVMDVKTIENARDTDDKYHFNRGINPRTGTYGWTDDDILRWYLQMQEGAREAQLGWTDTANLLNNFVQGIMFVTAHEAEEAFTELMESANVAKALLLSDNPTEIARRLGVEENEVDDYVVHYTDYINQLLKGIAPQMDVERYVDGEKTMLHLSEDHQRPAPEGSLDSALALQIYRYSLAEGGYHECKECHTIFVERDTKGRKSSGRSSAEFCSDKCRNRYNQRKLRERRKKDKIAQPMQSNK